MFRSDLLQRKGIKSKAFLCCFYQSSNHHHYKLQVDDYEFLKNQLLFSFSTQSRACQSRHLEN
jgi:hypothetical protein